VHAAVAVRLPTVEADRPDPEAFWRHGWKLAASPLDPGAGVPCRAAVVHRDGHPAALVVVFHHVCADDAGMRNAGMRFRSLLAGSPPAPAPQPLELAADESAAARRSARTLAYWAERYDTFVAADRLGTDRSHRSQAVLHSPPALAAAERLSADLGVSVQAVALAAAFLALWSATGRTATTMGLMSSNRARRAWSPIVASMNQLAPMTATHLPAQPPAELIRRVYADSMHAYSNGSYDVDALRDRLIEEGRSGPDPMEFDCYFNYVGESSAVYGPDHPASTGVLWQRPRRQSGPALHLTVATGTGLTLTLRASEAYLGAGRIPEVLGAIEAIILRLADGAAAVGHLDPTPVRPVHADSPEVAR
jgi:hypothetical protein